MSYALGHRWYLTTGPVFTADWEASSRNRWLVPVGAGLGKVIRFGKLPVDFTLVPYYHVVRPQAAPDWQLRFSVTPIFLKTRKHTEAAPQSTEAMVWTLWH